MKPHTQSVLQRCPAQGPVEREEMHITSFFVNSLPFERWNRIRWRTPVGWDTKSYAYGCPPLRRNGGSVTVRNMRLIAPKRLLFRPTPDGHETRRAWRVAGPKGQQNGWQPEKNEMSAPTWRPSCPEGKRPRASSNSPRRWACCCSWSWSRWFRR